MRMPRRMPRLLLLLLAPPPPFRRRRQQPLLRRQRLGQLRAQRPHAGVARRQLAPQAVALPPLDVQLVGQGGDAAEQGLVLLRGALGLVALLPPV
jgi:hypothetical protein